MRADGSCGSAVRNGAGDDLLAGGRSSSSARQAAPIRTCFRLLEAEPGSIAVSARAPETVPRPCGALPTALLPHPEVETEAMVLPFTQGSLAARAHQEGEVLSAERTEEGTLIKARAGRNRRSCYGPTSSRGPGEGREADPAFPPGLRLDRFPGQLRTV
jgi:hypothetical protein